MQLDFHYYATYCAAYIAGYTHEESLSIAYSAQFVDLCSKTFLKELGGPLESATTQLQMELMQSRSDIFTLSVKLGISLFSVFSFNSLIGFLFKNLLS